MRRIQYYLICAVLCHLASFFIVKMTSIDLGTVYLVQKPYTLERKFRQTFMCWNSDRTALGTCGSFIPLRPLCCVCSCQGLLTLRRWDLSSLVWIRGLEFSTKPQSLTERVNEGIMIRYGMHCAVLDHKNFYKRRNVI